MKILSRIVLNLIFLVIGSLLFFAFLGVLGMATALVSGAVFGILAGSLLPNLLKKRNDIDA